MGRGQVKWRSDETLKNVINTLDGSNSLHYRIISSSLSSDLANCSRQIQKRSNGLRNGITQNYPEKNEGRTNNTDRWRTCRRAKCFRGSDSEFGGGFKRFMSFGGLSFRQASSYTYGSTCAVGLNFKMHKDRVETAFVVLVLVRVF